MRPATALTSSNQLPFRGVPLAHLVKGRPRTPEFMQPEFYNQVMSPWEFDFSSNIALPSRELCDVVAQTPSDPNGDLIQAIIDDGGQAIDDPDVIAGVNLKEVCVYGPIPGRKGPILLAMYSQPLLLSSIPEDVSQAAARVTSASEPSDEDLKTELHAISDATRDKECALVHLCPICDGTYTRKASLKEHLRIHANKQDFVCDGPGGCGATFNTRHYLRSHLLRRHD